ncbi:ornithine cyclodeaminase family protein [Kribbella jiaozuonensis]|uniref:Ornithine cyclodeaminase family protein n=1 Tax=Kribbella jiaozuonensis TaxID=2575441 RepID=A0A4V5UVF3_9ACTN|nr:ornithine cyclodeaminase family protein [Kribbella jiaozuonensis]TKK72813.1 ornithine cyclodeaminase family protein [Kribbella jiaozuonensis]TKK78493.1 ornithine cyclodeaminase family protein [Kribbella jiaozuonensis]
MKVLSAEDVLRLVPMSTAVDAVRDAFRELAAGNFVLPPRQIFGDGTVLVMSAYHTPTGTAVVKKIGIALDQVPAIRATVIWTGNGEQLVADGSSITTLRTGAVVGVATDLLAQAGATRLTLIGTGAQAADQVRAVLAVRPITQITITGRSADRATALADQLATEFPEAKFTPSTSVEESIADTDIICCATSSTTPLFDADALPTTVHVNAIGAFRPTMRELPRNLLTTASTVVVDQREAALEESGEVIDAINSGALAETDLVELGPALSNPPTREGRTVFKSVGVGAQDWAIAAALANS